MARRGLSNAGTSPYKVGGENNSPSLLGVHAVIPSQGSWSGDNQLGIEVAFEPDRNNRQTILKLDEWGPPEEWTLSFFMRDDDNLYEKISIQAIIEFGAGGSTQTVNVDWASGVEITKTMNAVNIIAAYSSFDEDGIDGRGLRLGVQLARGTRGGCQPPRYTLDGNIPLVANGGTSTTYQVPPFAASLSLEIIGGIADPEDIRITTFSGNQGAAQITGILTGAQAQAGIALPVTGRSRFVIVENRDVDDDTNVLLYANLYG